MRIGIGAVLLLIAGAAALVGCELVVTGYSSDFAAFRIGSSETGDELDTGLIDSSSLVWVGGIFLGTAAVLVGAAIFVVRAARSR